MIAEMRSKVIQSLTKLSTIDPLAALCNKQNKSIMKKFLRRSLMIAIALVIANLFLANSSFAQTTRTWLPTNGGAWTTAGNWNPSGAPAANDNVIINSNQSAPITAVPTITLGNLTVSGNCNLQATTSGNTISIAGNFSVASGITLSLGVLNTRLQMTLNAGSTGSILGTVTLFPGGNPETFTNSGNLTMGSNGVINLSPGGTAPNFVLNSGATLQIGSPAGISTTGASGNILIAGSYATGANYVYNGAAAQAVGTGLPATVNSLTIANTGGAGNNTVTLAQNTTITTNLAVNSGTLSLNGFTANRASSGGTITVSNGATLLITGTNSFPTNYATHTLGATSTIQYGGTNQNVTIETYGNLSLSGSGNKTFAGATTIAGNLAITGAVGLLANSTTSTAATLTLGGVGQINGSWGGTGSAAAHKNATFFGTTTTGIVNVTQQSCTPPTINGTLSVCIGTTTQLSSPDAPSASNPWTSANTSAATINNSGLVTGVSTGTSVITFTNSIGCTNTATVTVNAGPLAHVDAQSNITCFAANDGTIQVSATAGASPYTFSVDNGTNYLPATGTNLRLFTGLLPNTPYRIKVKDNNGCVSK